MLAVPRDTPEAERMWRELAWEQLRADPTWPRVSPSLLRDLGVYGGGAGVWADLDNTRAITENGVAVSILHTGDHYDDDLDDRGILYYYPATRRRGSHDQNEVQSVKNAMFLAMPVFVVIKVGDLREVRRAWVMDFDDSSSQFLFGFSESPQRYTIEVDRPFEARESRRRTPDLVVRIERNPRFKFEVAKRFRGMCAVSDLGVPKMLEAAHVVPVSKGGSDDPRNGILLSASHHRAFDRQLWAINPSTLAIETRPSGPSLDKMKFSRRSVEHLADLKCLPHRDALEVNYELFREAAGL